MYPRRRAKHLGVRIRRAAIVGLALLGYAAGALGVPLPRATQTNSSEPLPSRQPACGCCAPSCCQGRCCCCNPTDKPPPLAQRPLPSAKPAAGMTWIIGMSARQCQGLETFWITGHVSLPPPPAVTWFYTWVLDSWLPLSNSLYLTHSAPPPTPPPR